MKLFSRIDEFVLLAVWRLQQDAYGVRIREQLEKTTGKEWSFGAVFVALERLVDRELLSYKMGESTPVRGGRAKRFYQLTPEGGQTLVGIRSMHSQAWQGITDAALKLGLVSDS